MLPSLICDTMKLGCFPKRSLAMRPDLVKQPVYSAAGSKPPRLGGQPSLIRVRGDGVKSRSKVVLHQDVQTELLQHHIQFHSDQSKSVGEN